MLFTDVSQPTFPDPWDVPTLSDTPNEDDLCAAAIAEEHARDTSPAASRQQTKQHSGWREMLADIQHGLQWGLEH